MFYYRSYRLTRRADNDWRCQELRLEANSRAYLQRLIDWRIAEDKADRARFHSDTSALGPAPWAFA